MRARLTWLAAGLLALALCGCQTATTTTTQKDGTVTKQKRLAFLTTLQGLHDVVESPDGTASEMDIQNLTGDAQMVNSLTSLLGTLAQYALLFASHGQTNAPALALSPQQERMLESLARAASGRRPTAAVRRRGPLSAPKLEE